MLNSMEIYRRIEALREKKGMTVNQLSARAGISHSTLNSWKIRGTMPKLEVVEGLCDALEVPLPSLLYDVYAEKLTGEEIELLSRWKKIDAKQKKILRNISIVVKNTPPFL